MVTLSHGVVLVDRALKVLARALLMPLRSLRSQQHVRRWSMAYDRLRSTSRVLVLVVRQRFAHYKMLAFLSLRLSMSHLFRIMAADHPSGGVYSLQGRDKEDTTRWHVIPAPSASYAGERG